MNIQKISKDTESLSNTIIQFDQIDIIEYYTAEARAKWQTVDIPIAQQN
jgi:hypothetical protein